MPCRGRSMPAKRPATIRVQVYLTDAKVIAALTREAKVSKLSLSQAAGRAIGRGLRRSVSADADDRLLALERRLGDHVRATSRDLQFVQELQVEALREFFLVLPEGGPRNELAAAVVERRIDRVLDRVAATLVRGSDRTGTPAEDEADEGRRLVAAE